MLLAWLRRALDECVLDCCCGEQRCAQSSAGRRAAQGGHGASGCDVARGRRALAHGVAGRLVKHVSTVSGQRLWAEWTGPCQVRPCQVRPCQVSRSGFALSSTSMLDMPSRRPQVILLHLYASRAPHFAYEHLSLCQSPSPRRSLRDISISSPRTRPNENEQQPDGTSQTHETISLRPCVTAPLTNHAPTPWVSSPTSNCEPLRFPASPNLVCCSYILPASPPLTHTPPHSSPQHLPNAPTS